MYGSLCFCHFIIILYHYRFLNSENYIISFISHTEQSWDPDLRKKITNWSVEKNIMFCSIEHTLFPGKDWKITMHLLQQISGSTSLWLFHVHSIIFTLCSSKHARVVWIHVLSVISMYGDIKVLEVSSQFHEKYQLAPSCHTCDKLCSVQENIYLIVYTEELRYLRKYPKNMNKK